MQLQGIYPFPGLTISLGNSPISAQNTNENLGLNSLEDPQCYLATFFLCSTPGKVALEYHRRGPKISLAKYGSVAFAVLP